VSRKLVLSKARPEADSPSAFETYKALREDGGAFGLRIKDVLADLISDAGKVRENSLAFRPGAWWATETETPDESIWWVVWRDDGETVFVRWIGPSPRTPGALAYTSG
jgi:hypothetical protein